MIFLSHALGNHRRESLTRTVSLRFTKFLSRCQHARQIISTLAAKLRTSPAYSYCCVLTYSLFEVQLRPELRDICVLVEHAA